MEALYIHIANKLESLRFGSGGGGYKLINLEELRTLALWRAVFAEFLAQVIFVFMGCASAIKISQGDFDNSGTDWLIKVGHFISRDVRFGMVYFRALDWVRMALN